MRATFGSPRLMTMMHHPVRSLSKPMAPRAHAAPAVLLSSSRTFARVFRFDGTVTDCLALRGSPMQGWASDFSTWTRSRASDSHSKTLAIGVGGRARANIAISFRFDTPRAGESDSFRTCQPAGLRPAPTSWSLRGIYFPRRRHLEDNRRGLWSLVILAFPQPGASIVLLFSCHAGSYVAEGVPLETEL